jgi:hypothetical protein
MSNSRAMVVSRQSFLLQARMLTTLNRQAMSIYHYQYYGFAKKNDKDKK